MSKSFKITFTVDQWKAIRRLSPVTGSDPAVLRALLRRFFDHIGDALPPDPAPPGGSRGGGRPRKHPTRIP